jgi:hypothetical protein
LRSARPQFDYLGGKDRLVAAAQTQARAAFDRARPPSSTAAVRKFARPALWCASLMTDYRHVTDELAKRLDAAGFEVLGAVHVGAYNQTLPAQLEAYRLPSLRSDHDAVLVIGNTRRLWPLFLHAYETDGLRAEAHPLDAYSRQHIGKAAAVVAEDLGTRHAVRYSFDPPPNTVAISRLASLAGVAEASPVGLCVHPDYGPWFSLRAAVVFDVQGPSVTPSRPTCSACTSRPCLPARDELLRTCGSSYDRRAFLENWRTWLAMRDACPVGRSVRYSDQQVRYHYLKDRAALTEPA